MGKLLGRIGPKTWLDFMVMCAGIVCALIIVFQWVLVVPGPNGWKIGYYIISIWVYVDTALFIKLGPFFASKFKNVSGAFSFLRDENDAKNFVVIIGGWTAALDTLMSAITSGGSYWVIVAYLGPLAVFGLFLLKGPLARLIARIRGGKTTTKAEKKPKEKAVKAEPKVEPKIEPKVEPKPQPKPQPKPEPKPEPAPAPEEDKEEEAPKPASKPATKPAKKTSKKAAKKPAST